MRLLWIGLLVGGCVDREVERVDEPEPEVPPTGVPFYNPSGVYEEDPQCRDLLGPAADTLTNRANGHPYASFALNQNGAVWTVSINGVVTPPGGGSPDGKTLAGTANGVRVKFVGGATNVGGFASYRLQYQSGTSWLEFCPPNERATALKGRWTSSAFRVEAEEITFGCKGSAMRKCYDFGYAPDDGAQATNDYDDASVRWRAHQACTRMA